MGNGLGSADTSSGVAIGDRALMSVAAITERSSLASVESSTPRSKTADCLSVMRPRTNSTSGLTTKARGSGAPTHATGGQRERAEALTSYH